MPSTAKTLGQHKTARAELLETIRRIARMPKLTPTDLLMITESDDAHPDWVGRELAYLLGRWSFHNYAVQVHTRNRSQGIPDDADD